MSPSQKDCQQRLRLTLSLALTNCKHNVGSRRINRLDIYLANCLDVYACLKSKFIFGSCARDKKVCIVVCNWEEIINIFPFQFDYTVSYHTINFHHFSCRAPLTACRPMKFPDHQIHYIFHHKNTHVID